MCCHETEVTGGKGSTITGDANDNLVPLSVRIGDDIHRCRSCLGLRIRARASAKERYTRRLDEMMRVLPVGGFGVASDGVSWTLPIY
jgi:hypothetical protein